MSWWICDLHIIHKYGKVSSVHHFYQVCFKSVQWFQSSKCKRFTGHAAATDGQKIQNYQWWIIISSIRTKTNRNKLKWEAKSDGRGNYLSAIIFGKFSAFVKIQCCSILHSRNIKCTVLIVFSVEHFWQIWAWSINFTTNGPFQQQQLLYFQFGRPSEQLQIRRPKIGKKKNIKAFQKYDGILWTALFWQNFIGHCVLGGRKLNFWNGLLNAWPLVIQWAYFEILMPIYINFFLVFFIWCKGLILPSFDSTTCIISEIKSVFYSQVI